MMNGKMLLVLRSVVVLSIGILASEINPVYQDPSDWRLQSGYRDYWIESQQCFRERDYKCGAEKLERLWLLKLNARHKVELSRSIAHSDWTLSEGSKFKNWQDAVLYASEASSSTIKPTE